MNNEDRTRLVVRIQFLSLLIGISILTFIIYYEVSGFGSKGFGPYQIFVTASGLLFIFFGILLWKESFRSMLLQRLNKLDLPSLPQMIIMALGGLCGGFIILEIALRIIFPLLGPDSRPKDALQYEPSLFARHVFSQQQLAYARDQVIPINSQGYRGSEFTIEKADDMYRIVIFGGSQVFDHEADQFQDWPAQVQSHIRKVGYNVEIINAGIPGHASFDSVGRLYSEVWQFEPDYVILDNCWNDIKYFNDLNDSQSLLRHFEPFTGHLCKGAANCFFSWSQVYQQGRRFSLQARNKVWAEGYVEQTGLDVINETALNQYQLNIELFVDIAHNINATPILATQPRLVDKDNSITDQQRINYYYVQMSHDTLVEGFHSCDEIINQVAGNKGVDVLDLSSEYSGRSDLFVDHIHFSKYGSEVISKHVSDYIISLLP